MFNNLVIICFAYLTLTLNLAKYNRTRRYSNEDIIERGDIFRRGKNKMRRKWRIPFQN